MNEEQLKTTAQTGIQRSRDFAQRYAERVGQETGEVAAAMARLHDAHINLADLAEGLLTKGLVKDAALLFDASLKIDG
jgi:hypothetical protein